MPDLIKGLALSELFYREAARPILDAHFPQLPHSAALIAWSSEVLGYDDLESTDHNWGPRFILFLREHDRQQYEQAISQTFSEKLPKEFRGYPTNFIVPIGGDQPVATNSDGATVRHKIDVDTVGNYFGWYLGCNPYMELSAAEWLTLSEHKLLAVTSGKVFHDGLGELEPLRRKFAYYPEQVWLHILACQWQTIAEEEAFVGRAGFVGDELGSAIIAARIVKNLMYLCFLMEKKYAPYAKWFGTAFARLECAPELLPLFRAVLLADDWKAREQALSRGYEAVARLHNRLGITETIEDRVTKHGRPYLVIHAERFVEAIARKVTSPELRRLGSFFGSVNQLVESDAELSRVKLCEKLKVLYT